MGGRDCKLQNMRKLKSQFTEDLDFLNQTDTFVLLFWGRFPVSIPDVYRKFRIVRIIIPAYLIKHSNGTLSRMYVQTYTWVKARGGGGTPFFSSHII